MERNLINNMSINTSKFYNENTKIYFFNRKKLKLIHLSNKIIKYEVHYKSNR